jgi:hypothetical protein
MKTLVRITEGQDTRLGYGFLTIQILNKPWKNSDTIEVIGHISFQRTLGDGGGKIWYAMKFCMETSSVKEMEQMTRVARAIKKDPDFMGLDAQPSQILKTIGAVEYKIFNHVWIPAAQEGQNLYNVMFLGSLYSNIVAPDEKAALKILKKRGNNKHELEFNSVVKF